MTTANRQALIQQYKEGYDAVQAALVGATDAELDARPAPNKWTAREIVHHLADSESTSALRLRRLLTEDRPVIQGYDQDEYARRLKYNERDMDPALAAFRAARESTLQVLRLMTESDWLREGEHTESGRYTPEDWLRIYAAHAHNHAAQIRRLRGALST